MEIKQMVDEWQEARSRRLEGDKRMKVLKSLEDDLAAALLQRMQEEGLSKALGDTHIASLRTREFYRIDDFPALDAFIRKTGRLDLLSKSVSKTAMDEYGAEVPGVTKDTKNYLTMKKV